MGGNQPRPQPQARIPGPPPRGGQVEPPVSFPPPVRPILGDVPLPAPYAEVTLTGRTWLLRRPTWLVRIVDGICVYGPGYGGTVLGWRVRGDRARVDRVAGRKLEQYLGQQSPAEHRITVEEIERG